MAPKDPHTINDPSYSPHSTNNIDIMNNGSQHNRSASNNNQYSSSHVNSGGGRSSSRSDQQRQQRSSRSRRVKEEDPPGGGYEPRQSGSSSHQFDARRVKKSSEAPTPASRSRREQRRRPTNYTSSYTPPASLVEHAKQARATKAQSSSRNKVSSLDRSEEDGDERQRRLRSGKQGGGGGGNGDYPSQHEQQIYEQQQQLQQIKEQHYARQKLEQQRDRHSSDQQQQGSSSSSRSSGRRASQEGYQHSQHKQQYNQSQASASASSIRNHHSQKQSSSSNNRRSSNQSISSNDSSLTEQQRIEEYAGKRALLRVEQELADHSESQLAMGEDAIRSVMDRRKLGRVPQVKKSDLIIGEYLGRGNFCDVFEVTWILPEQQQLYGDDDDSDGGASKGASTVHESLGGSMESLALSCSNDLSLIRNEGMQRTASLRSVSQIRTTTMSVLGGTNTLRNSFSKGSIPSMGMMTGGMRNPNVLALKCLRPAVRAQPRKFVIGAEDLAHETALLACLDHPNIIQLYGRAEGCFSTAFQMRSKSSNSNNSNGKSKSEGKQMSNEGYFIILDRLMATLTDRIDEWKDECRAINGVAPPDGTPVKLPPESTLREHLCKRLKVAYCIADAIEYLHSRHVVFRDLKPANVGFDCNDCVKMFDFGFATSIAPLMAQPYEGYGPLTETCGTRRYMAPEVALKLGYGKEVDVYSFGMLLWEICAMDKPFDSIQSVDEFHDFVVLCGRRPSLNIDPLWTSSLKHLMSRCWSTDPLDRPTMAQVKSLMHNVLRDMNKAIMEGSSSSRVGSGSGNGNGRGISGSGRGGTQQQRQEQGGNFINKWRRRVSI